MSRCSAIEEDGTHEDLGHGIFAALARIDYEFQARGQVGAKVMDSLAQVEGDLLALRFGVGSA